MFAPFNDIVRKQLAYIRQGSPAESLPGLFLLRRFRLAACVAFCRDGRGRGRRRAHEGPANAGGVPRILPNHDLSGAAGTVIPRQEHAVLHFDLVVERLEGPDVAVRQHQHHAAPVAQSARLHRRMQMKPQRIIGLGAFDPGARRRRKRVLAVDPGAVLRDHQHPRSEEHTSELQSRSDLVCRLLLEKKKKKKNKKKKKKKKKKQKNKKQKKKKK